MNQLKKYYVKENGRTISYEISNDKKKLIFTIKRNPNETVSDRVYISYYLELKKPISDEVEFKVTLTNDNYNLSAAAFNSKSDTGIEKLADVRINGPSYTFKNLDDTLKNSKLLITAEPKLDTTSTSDYVLTFEIIN